MSRIRPVHVLAVTLFAATLIAPATAQHWLDDGGEDPDMTFSRGEDWAQAKQLGFAGGFERLDGGKAFNLTLAGLAGGAVAVDELIVVEADDVDGYRWNVEEPAMLDGAEIRARIWTGPAPPAADGDPAVCTVVDLTRPGPSQGRCTADRASVQVVYTLRDGAEGMDDVTIRPEVLVSGQV